MNAKPPPGGRPPPRKHERRTLAEPPPPSAGLFGPAPIAPVRALGLLALGVATAGLGLTVFVHRPPPRAQPPIALPELTCERMVELRAQPAAHGEPAPASPSPSGKAGVAPTAPPPPTAPTPVPLGSRLVCAEHLAVPSGVALETGDAWVQDANGGWRHHPGGMVAPLRLLLDLPLPLNQASVADLTLLPGLNGRQARAIVAHRERCGPFPTLDGLLRVHGVGKKTLVRIRPRLAVESAAAEPSATPAEAGDDDDDGGGDGVADGGTAADASAAAAVPGGTATQRARAPKDGAEPTGEGTAVDADRSKQGEVKGTAGADVPPPAEARGGAAPEAAEALPPLGEPESHPLDAPLPQTPLAPPPSYGHGLDARRSWMVDILRHLPQASLSRVWGWLARRERPRPLVRLYQRAFISSVGIDLTEAEYPLAHYPSLQALFGRRLKGGLRPIDAHPAAVVSPVDGRVGQCGTVTEGTMLQVKGRSYSLARLLGDPARAAAYEGGAYATMYLAPRDYHRIHAPVAGTVHEARLITGSLLPVFEESLHKIDELFARNERIVTYLRPNAPSGAAADTDDAELAVVKVAATLVGCIRVSYDDTLRGNVAGAAGRSPRYAPPMPLARGAELGAFELGSTVVLVGRRGQLALNELKFGQRVHVGERIGTLLAAAPAATHPSGRG